MSTCKFKKKNSEATSLYLESKNCNSGSSGLGRNPNNVLNTVWKQRVFMREKTRIIPWKEEKSPIGVDQLSYFSYTWRSTESIFRQAVPSHQSLWSGRQVSSSWAQSKGSRNRRSKAVPLESLLRLHLKMAPLTSCFTAALPQTVVRCLLLP